MQEEIKEPNSESKDSATIRTKISNGSSENHGRTNTGEKKRGKKLKTSMREMKTKKWEKKPEEKKIIPTPESGERVESEEFETISCTEIISEDDLKSKCECEKVKFLKRYEIPELLIK